MRIPSGVTDQYIYFVAVDSTDFTTRETGLSSFTVYRSRNGGAAAAMTTPTINETDATNMPGVYELLLDEDMTIDSGDDSQEMVFHITHTGMAPVTRTIELYRPKLTAGETLTVTSGLASADAVQISGDATAANNAESFFDGTGYAGTNNVIPTVTTVTGAVGSVTGNVGGNVVGSVASVTGAVGSVTGNVGGNVTGSVGSISGVTFPTNFGDLAITVTTGLVSVGTNNDKTGYSISGTITTLDALDTAQDAQHATTQGLVTTIDGIVDNILLDTDELQTNQGNWLTATGFSTHSAADVWAVATRVLTAGTNIDGSTFTAIPWNAAWDAEVQSECSDALTAYAPATAANLTLAQADITSILADTGTNIPALIAALNDIAVADIWDDANGVETGITPRQALRALCSAVAGVLSGAATTTITTKAIDNSGTTRIVATVDADGNRSALTLTL